MSRFTQILQGLALAATLVLAGCSGSSASGPSTGNNVPFKPQPVGRSATYVSGGSNSTTYDLLAGQNTLAGHVVITNDTTNLTVVFTTVGDWVIMKDHVYVGLTPPPTNAPGQWPYKHDNLGGVTTDTFVIPLPTGAVCGSTIYVSTHADLQEYNPNTGIYFNGQTGFGKGQYRFPRGWGYYIGYTVTPSCPLPTADICITGAYPGSSSYWGTTLSGVPAGYVVHDGLYVGWCVDLFHFMTPGQQYCGTHLYSSYDPNLPAGLQDDDWDMVNYILNHKQGGTQDVQNAIWFFIGSGALPPAGPGLDMVNDALAHGEGFVPGPGETTAIIVFAGESVQITIIEVLCDC